MAEEWLTTAEAAEISGYHIVHLRRLIRSGRLRAKKRGRDWWVDGKALKALLKETKSAKDRRQGPKGPR